MKHVFSSIKKDRERADLFLADADRVESAIQTFSRIAGPVALCLGYVGVYVLVRYIF